MKTLITSLLLLLSFTLNAQVAGWFTNADSAGTAEPATFYDQIMIGSNGEAIRIKTGSGVPYSTSTLGGIGDLFVTTNGTGSVFVKQDSGDTTNWKSLNKNLSPINNSSFEDSSAGTPGLGWTITSGTPSVELTTIVPSEGEQALELAVSASAFEMYQTFDCSDYDTIPLGFSAYVSATPTSELEICGFDGTTDINCTSLYTSSTSTAILGYQKVLAENTGGGTCGIKFKSDATITETIHIDGVEFTDMPYRYVDVQNTTEWVSFTPVATGFGTIADAGAVWRRVGDSMEVRVSYNFGTPTAVDAELDIPNGYKIDLTKIEHAEMNYLGDWQYVQTSQGHTQAGWRGVIFSDQLDSSAVYFSSSGSGGGAGILDKTDGDGLGLTGQGFTINFTVPIQGWSATSSNVATPAKSNLSNWTEYTPTFVGFGSPTGIKAYWKRVGDSIKVRFKMTPVTPTAVTASMSLPTGINIDADKLHINNNISGIGDIIGTTYTEQLSANVMGHMVAAPATDTNLVYFTVQISNAGNKTVPDNGNSVVASGNIFQGELTVPIEGWSGEDYFLSMMPLQKVAFIKDVKGTTVLGGTFTSGGWRTRDLNTVTGDSDIVSLASNQITLQAGKYTIEATAPAYACDRSTMAIYNVTTSSYIALGPTVIDSAGNSATIASVDGALTITGETIIEIRHRAQTTRASDGFGVANSFGLDEIYTQVKVTKLISN